MAISRYVWRTIRRLSNYDLDVTEHYPLVRRAKDIASPKPILNRYSMWDYKIYSQTDGYEIPVRIFLPECQRPNMQILLFFHGGGWVTGNIDNYSRTCAGMAKMTDSIVVSVDYRLAPEHKFPTGLFDCYDATCALFEHVDLFNTTTDQITLIGDSAGGNLAAAVSLKLRDEGRRVPNKQILLYPATYNDHSPLSRFSSVRTCGHDYLLTSERVRQYLSLYVAKQEDYNNYYLAPLLCSDLSNQPATLVITAQYDPLRDEGEEYARRLARDGTYAEFHRIADTLHGFIALPPRTKQVSKMYHYINRFIKCFNEEIWLEQQNTTPMEQA